LKQLAVGKNKLKKFAEMETFEHVVQVPFQAIQENGFRLKGNWSNSFFGNNNPIVLELGCGKGEYTIKMAQHFPEINFIGIDIKGSRMWKGATLAKELALKNVCFLRTNIENIHLFFAPGEISEIWLTFPDPQMKKQRKRLTSISFLDNYRQVLSSEGIVHLKTDSNFMFAYTGEVIKANNFVVLHKTIDLYQSDLLDEVLSIKTFYEKQWLDRGLSIKYLSFRMNHNEQLIEPDIEIEKDPYRSFGRSARE
jgi:tRNA (guanine-N7-)-methyltransferase